MSYTSILSFVKSVSLTGRTLMIVVLILAAVETALGQDASDRKSINLIPFPREVTSGATLRLSPRVTVKWQDEEDRFAAEDLLGELTERGIKTAANTKLSGVTIQLLRLNTSVARQALSQANLLFNKEMEPEGYVVTYRGQTVAVIGASSAGMFYGVQTIKQMVEGRGESARLNAAKIRDWPAMKYRGVDDDLARGPFPTLDFQKRQIRTLASFKINIYSPYFEDTFAYQSDPLSWLPGASMSPSQAVELVRYAAQYHVMIIPQQEAFGHLHHLLTLEQYSALAENPLGMVLAPKQAGSIQLIERWFQQLATVFPAPFIHIGADETLDLGAGQSAAEVKQSGLGAVYVDFVNQIYEALQPIHKRLLFWGDMAMNDPALVSKLPKDMIAVAWHYSPEPNGFDPWLRPYVNAGMETWVAPGGNNWSQVYPNNDMTLLNVQGFVRDGQKLGSTGMLMTVWNDDGEGLFLQDWYGLLFAAAAAWQLGESSISQYQDAYGPMFHGDHSGKINQAQRELIYAHQALMKAGVGDETDALFWIDPWSPAGLETSKKLLPVTHDLRLHAERAVALISEVSADNNIRERDALEALDLGARRMDFIGLKFQSAQLILDGYSRALAGVGDPSKSGDVDRELWTITGSDGRCEDLQEGYNYIRDEYREVWLKENRSYSLANVMDRYNAAAELWGSRSDVFANAEAQWNAHHRLPSTDELGIPPRASSHCCQAKIPN